MEKLFNGKKWILGKNLYGYFLTSAENYTARISDERKIAKLRAIGTLDETFEYIEKYFHLSRNEIFIAF